MSVYLSERSDGGMSALFIFMNESKTVTVLGSTGSIGTQTLDVARAHGFKIKCLSAHSNAEKLEEQAREFHPEAVCVTDINAYNDLKQRLADTSVKLLFGTDGLCELAAQRCDMVVNAVVGMVGLLPTLSAIEAGNRVGLANKETLVAGGELVKAAAKRKNVDIIPIDSEHSAIFQSLMGNNENKIAKIILTASGGPFFGYDRERLRTVTKEQALHHPNWTMGRKITIDSATLMNKGLELIEAVRLFDVSAAQVQVVVHRQSILHSAVEYEDGAVIGQLGVPDMRIPIQFALTYPKRYASSSEKLDLFKIGTLTFEPADEDTFVCLALARKAVTVGGTAPCVLNSANEAAVAAFLDDRISFYRIFELVTDCCNDIKPQAIESVESVLSAEKQAKEYVASKI